MSSTVLPTVQTPESGACRTVCSRSSAGSRRERHADEWRGGGCGDRGSGRPLCCGGPCSEDAARPWSSSDLTARAPTSQGAEQRRPNLRLKPCGFVFSQIINCQSSKSHNEMCGGNGKFASEKRSPDTGVLSRRSIAAGAGRSCRGAHRVTSGFAAPARPSLKKCILWRCCFQDEQINIMHRNILRDLKVYLSFWFWEKWKRFVGSWACWARSGCTWWGAVPSDESLRLQAKWERSSIFKLSCLDLIWRSGLQPLGKRNRELSFYFCVWELIKCFRNRVFFKLKPIYETDAESSPATFSHFPFVFYSLPCFSLM